METSTWNEIKLRNPSPALCANVKLLIDSYGERSASKALEKYINDYPVLTQQIKQLNEKISLLNDRIDSTTKENSKLKNTLSEIKLTYNTFVKLITGDKIST